MLLIEKDIAIDLGTATTQVYVQGKGVALREPTVMAVDKNNGKLLKIGAEAQKMLGRTPANIVAIHPISAGVISDFDMTEHLLAELIKRVTSFNLFKPRIIICVPSSITGVEERAILDATIEAGARKVYLLETAVAAALGSGRNISRPDGHMVIDIGGGTTEVAVVSLGGIVECESIKTAGASFDEALVRYIRRKHNVLIGQRTAEELKMRIGCVYLQKEVAFEEVKGRCLMTGLPRSVTISSNDILEAFAEPTERILEAVHMVLERTPPELAADISANGIVMCGGGSLISGIDKLVAARTGIETMVVDDPVSCAAYGAGKMLANLNNMQDGMINLARRRQMKG
ncbi:MAG: rod shape-determining protein [Oscillospiraceae bacterium]|nr:rod shape-determining protein [Oscillospiraceae bacterium]MBR6561400.1 rod shape-determining protein [Oscillospiraceae bacterium]